LRRILCLQTIVIIDAYPTPWVAAQQPQAFFPANQAMPPKKSAANIALGQAARSLRTEQGLAQEAFAARAGMDRANYGAIERGEFNVSLDTIVKIAAGLRVSAASLLDRAGL
jgi:DNA-binding XRE family transcriptional regulator